MASHNQRRLGMGRWWEPDKHRTVDDLQIWPVDVRI